ncbi:MAG: DUF6159 family protein [Microthrixaceae bacterium]
MGRIANTVSLAKSSWGVLRSDPELLVLPVLSGVASLAVSASFLVPIWFSTGGVDQLESGEMALGPAQYGLLFAMYLVLSFITVFFNAALISGAHERMSGGNPTLGSALAGATKHLGAIAAWSVVAAVVSTVLRSIEQRSGLIGRLVVSVVGLAWALVTFLVLPAIVIEGVGVREAFTRSTTLFKGTWGERMAANVGFGLLWLAAVLLAVPFVAAAFATGSAAALGAMIGIAVLWLIGVGVVIAGMSGVFQTALYHYASTGEAPQGGFDSATLAASFRPRG